MNIKNLNKTSIVNLISAAVIVTAAIALRLTGIRWGLPNSLHLYSYHPDEFLIVGSAVYNVFTLKTINPRFFNYPSLYIYLTAIGVALAFYYGAPISGIGLYETIYLTPRVITAIMGVGTVIAAIWAGQVLFGKTAGLLAGLFIAIAPLHVQHSHFATVDVPSTFFIALTLGFAGLINKQGELKHYLLAGIMSGFAAGTKYNAGLIILSAIAAHFMRRDKKSKYILITLAGAFGAFALSTPMIIIGPGQVLRGIFYEMRHAATGHGLVFAGTGNGFLYTLLGSLWPGMGSSFVLLIIASLVWAVVKRNEKTLVILAFAVPYFILISMSQVRFARYSLPLFPAFALMAGWLIADIWARLSPKQSGLKIAWIFICASLFISTLAYAIKLDTLFVRPDPRDQATRWIRKNIKEGSKIGVMEVPWFYSPAYTNKGGEGPLPTRMKYADYAPYRLIIFSEYSQPGKWNKGDSVPDWVVLSDYEIEDALRLRDNRFISCDQRKQVNKILGNLQVVEKKFKKRAVFTNRGGLHLPNLPHDMRYSSPVITIYERK